MYAGRKILVAGGTGMIGWHAVDELLRLGARVRIVVHRRPNPFDARVEVVSGDLRDFEICRRAVCGCAFAVHAAGVTGGIKSLTLNPLATFGDNTVMNTNLLEAARAEGVERYAFISNTSVYADTAAPLTEEGSPPVWEENHTGAVKRLGELQCRLYAKHGGMKIAIVRGGNGYGPWDNFDLEGSHALPALVRKAVERRRPFLVWGKGEARRDFTHARDIARGVLHMLEHYAVCDPVHVATGVTTSINDLAKLTLKLAGDDGAPIVHDAREPEGPAVKAIDITKMNRLGFQPKISLEEGLRETIAWYEARTNA